MKTQTQFATQITRSFRRLSSAAFLLLCPVAVPLALVGLATAPSAAHAQTTGTISGTVTDKGGALVPNVQVSARNTDSGDTRTTVSNKAGEYSFPALAPGDYAVTFKLDGFATTVETATLSVTEHVAVNTSLQLSSLATTVEVTSSEPLLQTETITQGSVITGQEAQDLPLATNNFTQLLALSPGVSGEVNDATGLGRGTQNVNANGARTSSNSIYVDGIDAVNVHVNSAGNNSFASNGTVIPPTAAIQEFKIQTALFEAATGRSGGSNIFLVTRTGGDKLHGQVYEYFRNDIFNANTYFFNNTGQPRPKLKQNQFGGTIGGPIFTQKLHGFFSYQGTRQINGYAGSKSLTLPLIPEDRSVASLGAFGATLGATSYTGPSIKADGSNISPTALAILNLKLPNGKYVIPSPQLKQAGVVNYTVSVPSTFNEDEYTGSMTYELTQKDSFVFHTIIAEQPQFQSMPQTYSVPGFGLNQLFKSRLYSVSETHVFTSNLVNEFRMGLSRLLGHTSFENQVPLSAIGMTKFNSGDFPYIPTIQLSRQFQIGYSVNADQADTENTWQYFDNVSWLKGKHNMNFGAEMRRYQDNYFSNNRQAGSLDVISFQNFLLGLNGQPVAQGGNGTGHSDVYSYSVASGKVQRYDRIRDVAFFAQDSWKPIPTLTLNLGMRYEYIGLPTDVLGRNGAFDTRRYQAPPAGGVTSIGFVQAGNAVNPVPGLAKVSNTLTDNVGKTNFGPRVGFALQMNKRQVLRGGYGLFFDRLSNQLGLLESLSLPNYVRSDQTNGATPLPGKIPVGFINTNSTLANPYPTLPLRAQFPILPVTSSSSAPGALTGVPIAINDVDPLITTPYYQQYALNIQTQILPSIMYEVGYVGAHGLHLPSETEINQAQIASATAPINGNTDNSGDPQIRAPYQGLSIPSLYFLQTNQMSNYNSLQNTLNVRKGHTHALFTYTYSKTLDTSSGTRDGSVFDTWSGDQTNIRQAYGPSDYDRTHLFNGRFVYTIPRPKFKFARTSLGRKLLTGYDLSGTMTYRSGRPINVTNASGATLYGTDTSRASYATGMGYADSVKTGRTEDRLRSYFNTTAFVSAGQFYGNVGRNTLRGPSQQNYDLSLAKRTHVFENVTAEFRAQAFNVLNHPNFSNPASDFTGSGFGAITSTTGNPRILQFLLRLQF